MAIDHTMLLNCTKETKRRFAYGQRTPAEQLGRMLMIVAGKIQTKRFPRKHEGSIARRCEDANSARFETPRLSPSRAGQEVSGSMPEERLSTFERWPALRWRCSRLPSRETRQLRYKWK